MLPLLTAAVPINSILGIPVLRVLTPTLTVVWIPDLYPEPLFPIATELIVPRPETIAVAPAATKGWYPSPWVDPTDIIIPPTGTLAVFGSDVTEEADPVNWILVIPEFSDNV